MTLDSHEIRLGNTYKIEMGDGICKSDLINLEDLSNLLDYDLDDFYQAMELDEVWLIKLGFEYDEHYNNYVIKAKGYYNSVGYNDEDGDWYYNNDRSNAGCYYITSIQYVHQLENLYFALTGKELTYKC
jgi:hypothetical protein